MTCHFHIYYDRKTCQSQKVYPTQSELYYPTNLRLISRLNNQDQPGNRIWFRICGFNMHTLFHVWIGLKYCRLGRLDLEYCKANRKRFARADDVNRCGWQHSTKVETKNNQLIKTGVIIRNVLKLFKLSAIWAIFQQNNNHTIHLI